MSRAQVYRPSTNLALLGAPYDRYEEIGLSWTPTERPPRGKSIIWWLVDARVQEDEFTWLQERPPGLPLIILLPPAQALSRVLSLLNYVALLEPRAVLPFTRSLGLESIRRLLKAPPRDVPLALTHYLTRRGLLPHDRHRQDVRAIFQLAPAIKSIARVAAKLSTSRRTLGRRFMAAGLPVPSHWLQFGRLFHVALRLQQESTAMFRIAGKLGYPDGFTMSNQMKRLIDCRPTDVRLHLGWEWIVESWIQRELHAGQIDAARYGNLASQYMTSEGGSRV